MNEELMNMSENIAETDNPIYHSVVVENEKYIPRLKFENVIVISNLVGCISKSLTQKYIPQKLKKENHICSSTSLI